MKSISLKSILCICFFVAGFHALAQDTIFYKTQGSSIIVLVKEVSQTQVQYKKIEMPDGPMYIINKSDIAKIVYKNGYTEIIKETVPEPVNTATQPFTLSYSNTIGGGSEKITYQDTKRRNGSIINLIDRHPNPERRTELMSSLSKMKHLKAGQDATRTVAIVFGALTIPASVIAVFAIALGGADSFTILPVTTGAVALACTAAAVTFNIGLKKKRRAFVDLYNQ